MRKLAAIILACLFIGGCSSTTNDNERFRLIYHQQSGNKLGGYISANVLKDTLTGDCFLYIDGGHSGGMVSVPCGN